MRKCFAHMLPFLREGDGIHVKTGVSLDMLMAKLEQAVPRLFPSEQYEAYLKHHVQVS